MKVGFNPSVNGVSFRAVNQKYLKWAENDFKNFGDIGTNWIDNLSMDVFLFEDISKKDAKDTLNAVKKYVSKNSVEVFDDYFKDLYV